MFVNISSCACNSCKVNLWLFLCFFYVHSFNFRFYLHCFLCRISLFLLARLDHIDWIECDRRRAFWHSSCNKRYHPVCGVLICFCVVEEFASSLIDRHWDHAVEAEKNWNRIASEKRWQSLLFPHIYNSLFRQLKSRDLFLCIVEVEHSSSLDNPNRISN